MVHQTLMSLLYKPEEVDRFRSMNVIEDYRQQTGEELVLDARQAFDWRYRHGQRKRRCRLVAREFWAGFNQLKRHLRNIFQLCGQHPADSLLNFSRVHIGMRYKGCFSHNSSA